MKKISLFLLFGIFLLSETDSFSALSVHRQQPLTKTQVLIIGAGISGLAAANYLTKHQVSVLVLEARNRIGGRIFTVKPWGLGLDLGASWIHGINNNPIAILAKKQKIATIPTIYTDSAPLKRFDSVSLYNTEGKRLDEAQTQKIILLVQQFDKLLQTQKNLANNLGIEKAYKNFAQKAHLKREQENLLHYLISMMYLYEYASDLKTLSASTQTAYSGSIVSGKNVIFPSGYSQILPPLAKNIPIQLKQQVTHISYGPQGVDVYTEHRHFHADYLILTVPLGVLKSGKIHFSPALPQQKQKSISKLQMGSYDKIFLYFDRPFWDKKYEWIGYVPPAGSTQQPIDILNYYKYSGMPVLIIFTGGSLAKTIERWSDKKTLRYLMSILRKIYGAAIPQPTSYVITRWDKDPYSYGSYSFLPVGVTTQYFKLLAKPVANRLFFAGEATSATDPATVHGAYSTGIRAATEVLQEITLKQPK